MRPARVAIVASFLAAGWLGPAGRADWLYFTRGGQAELPASVIGTTVRLETPDGSRTIPLGACRSFVPGPRLDDECQRRLQAARHDGSAGARFVAAWWALEQGLTSEATGMLREAAGSPGIGDHAPLLRARRMLDRLDVPVAESDAEPIRCRLGGTGWAEAQGRHVTLIHQASAAEAAERLDLLDRVVDTFYLSLAAQGVVDLAVPSRRLISVWFARQADYIAFLGAVDAAPFATTQGFYHPTFRVVFAFDTRSTPDQARPRGAIARRSANGTLTTGERADLDVRSLLLDLQWRSVDLGILAHETVHQLVAASGLAAYDDWPHWLHEGFAAQFEVVRGGRWAGFGRANDFRLPDYRSIHPGPELAPLLHDDGLAHGYNRARYAEAWALVYYLRKTQPAEFAAFLNLLRMPRSPQSMRPTIEVFRSACGDDLDTLQLEWRRFMRDQQTPLEAYARPAIVAKSR